MTFEYTVYVTKFQNKCESNNTIDELFPEVKNAIFMEFNPVYTRTHAIKQMLLFFKHDLMLYNSYIIFNDNEIDNEIVIKNKEHFLNMIHMYTANHQKHVSFTYNNIYNETVKFDIYENVTNKFNKIL